MKIVKFPELTELAELTENTEFAELRRVKCHIVPKSATKKTCQQAGFYSIGATIRTRR